MGEPAPPAATPPFPLPATGASPPAPPVPAPPVLPEPPAPGPPPEPDDQAELRTALAEERRRHRETMQALSALQQQGMTDQEKAVADAKAAGRSEAIREAGLRVAAAEFRAMAAGKLADPEAALEVLNLSAFVNDEGEVDKKAMAKMVEKLVAQLAPAGARIPAGPMGDGGSPDGDFLRQVMGSRGRALG